MNKTMLVESKVNFSSIDKHNFI